MSFEKESVVRLYVKGEGGVCLEICPNPDAPDFGIVLYTPNQKSIDWYGKVNIILNPDECRKLGEEMVKYADQFEKDMA